MKIKSIHIIIVTFFALIFGQSCKKDTNKNNNIDIKKSDKIDKVYPKKASLSLQSVNNSEVLGSVIFKENNGEITMIALVNNLKEGIYKMYITNDKDCISSTVNEDLHWNPTNQKHGVWGDKEGYHKGDIGRLKADVLGNGMLSFSTNEWCISCDDETKDIIGKRLIVTTGDDSVLDNKSNIVLCCGLIEEEKKD